MIAVMRCPERGAPQRPGRLCDLKGIGGSDLHDDDLVPVAGPEHFALQDIEPFEEELRGQPGGPGLPRLHAWLWWQRVLVQRRLADLQKMG